MREVGDDSEGRADDDAETEGDADGDADPGGRPDGGEDPVGPAPAEAPPPTDGTIPVNDTELTPPTDADPTEERSDFAVPTETDSERETAWRRRLAEAGELTADAVDAIVTVHGGRGVRAVEAVSEGRVKRYRDFTVVVGYAEEYIVEDGGCTCKDSSYNLDPEEDDQRCWHVLAAAVAERIGEVDHHDMWYSDVREFL